jgi:hypothetical protein
MSFISSCGFGSVTKPPAALEARQTHLVKNILRLYKESIKAL